MSIKPPKSNYLYAIVLLALLIASLTSCSKSTSWEDLPWIETYQIGMNQARHKNRPAFIYFQARWCSWCHIYEKDILSQQSVMNILQQDYVLVLVNYDARPDLLQHFAGFGLPYSVIVAPDGKVLARLSGILSAADMVSTLTDISQGKVHSAPSISSDIIHVNGLDKKSYADFHRAYLDYLQQLYDTETGTLTGHLATAAGLKRPSPRTWLYLMQQELWPRRSKAAATNIQHSLWDDIDGGFFYFLDPHRADEHLETSRLLPANAWLSNWLAEAGQRYQNAQLIHSARQGIDYLQKTLWDTEEGGFYQAQFSDSEYYRLNKDARARRSAPAIDSIKRVDSNAQAAFALLQLSERLNASDAYKLAAKTMATQTIDYVLQYHYQHGRLYHSRDQAQLGPAYNLATDLFWLLAAGEALQTVSSNQHRQKQLLPIKKLAAQWLKQAMQQSPRKKISVELLGLIAWVSVTATEPYLSSSATAWALRGIRIDPNSQPDELIFALMAWQKYLRLSP
jgi:hypothetical protein